LKTVVSAVMGVVRFFYRFIVGDDWTVAAVMLLALLATAVLAAQQISALWLVPLMAIVTTVVSLRRSTRTS
jgi:hypothetical protein